MWGDTQARRTGSLLTGFEEKFGWRLSQVSLASWAYSKGLRKAQRWTEEARAYLVEIVPGRSHCEIAAMMGERFGPPFADVELVKGAIARYRLNTGRTGCFPKGHEPANKGRTWDEYLSQEKQRRCRATTFKPGSRPHNRRAVGSERVGKDGYLWVKVESRFDPDGHNDWRDLWKPKHRAVWEEANGRQTPEGSMIVFADGDIRNFDPDNLVCMTMAEHAVICHQGIAYHDRESCEAAIAIARLQSRVYARSKRKRTCRECGREFEPEQPRQARCRECIDARKESMK